jgi:hypothetical protein
MRFTLRSAIIVVMLGATFAAGRAWATAQLRSPEPVTPTVFSGNDIGFRMEGRRGTTPVGAIVVRIDGEWVEVEFGAGKVYPITSK